MHSSAIATLALLATIGSTVSVPISPSVVPLDTPSDTSTVATSESKVGNSGTMEFAMGIPHGSMLGDHTLSAQMDPSANSAAQRQPQTTHCEEPAKLVQLPDHQDDDNSGELALHKVANHASAMFIRLTQLLGTHPHHKEPTREFAKLLTRQPPSGESLLPQHVYLPQQAQGQEQVPAAEGVKTNAQIVYDAAKMAGAHVCNIHFASRRLMEQVVVEWHNVMMMKALSGYHEKWIELAELQVAPNYFSALSLAAISLIVIVQKYESLSNTPRDTSSCTERSCQPGPTRSTEYQCPLEIFDVSDDSDIVVQVLRERRSRYGWRNSKLTCEIYRTDSQVSYEGTYGLRDVRMLRWLCPADSFALSVQTIPPTRYMTDTALENAKEVQSFKQLGDEEQQPFSGRRGWAVSSASIAAISQPHNRLADGCLRS
ncbi:hypothetical protein BC835DRAFT_1304164 [Cytidiella melzeri]|nr:hypothetical protein BC835DRAFT_1304164 [Cytidiella melzeri]